MSKMYVAGATLLMLAGTEVARAADLAPVAPVKTDGPDFNWVGLYVGINAGGAHGRSSQGQVAPPNLSTGDFGVSGGMIGGTLGFNLEVDHVVFGLEGDVDWSGVNGTVNCPTAGFTCSTGNDYLATVRGRLGYSWYRVMPYVTAGGAIGDIRQGFSPPIGTNNGIRDNRVGWTAGAGVELAFWYQWSVKFEYLHVDLGTFSCNVACTGAAAQTINTTLSEDLFRTGVNYRF